MHEKRDFALDIVDARYNIVSELGYLMAKNEPFIQYYDDVGEFDFETDLGFAIEDYLDCLDEQLIFVARNTELDLKDEAGGLHLRDAQSPLRPIRDFTLGEVRFLREEIEFAFWGINPEPHQIDKSAEHQIVEDDSSLPQREKLHQALVSTAATERNLQDNYLGILIGAGSRSNYPESAVMDYMEFAAEEVKRYLFETLHDMWKSSSVN